MDKPNIVHQNGRLKQRLELSNWAEKRCLKQRMVEFLAVRDDIEAALNAGFSVKTIWKQLHELGKITYDYRNFVNHVNHLKSDIAARGGRSRSGDG